MPAGTLTTQIRLPDDWPHGDHIPFIDDYQLPRSNKPLVTGLQDLDALGYLLVRPTDEDAASYLQEARRAHEFAQQQAVILAGGWGVGLDLANWLYGMQNLMVLALEQPDVETLGRERFVLSPIDTITVDDPLTWENISILIDEWQKRR